MAEIRALQPVLSIEIDSALASLVAVAEDSGARPSSRVKAREAIKMIHGKIMAYRPAAEIGDLSDQIEEEEKAYLVDL